MKKKYLSIIIGALIISISIGAYTYVNYKIDPSKGMTNVIKKINMMHQKKLMNLLEVLILQKNQKL